MLYIDAHTHNPQSGDLRIFIQNLNQIDLSQNYFCLGIHPWYVNQHTEENIFELMNKQLNNSAFIGIGEVGLDKKCKVSLEEQITILKSQVKFSIQNKFKLLVLHNVKTYSETLQILIEAGYKHKVLLHDFYANKDVFKQYSKHFDTYVSLGARLFTQKKNQYLIRELPRNKILLETDDQTTYTIKEIYELASELISEDLKDLCEQLSNNFNTLIGN